MRADLRSGMECLVAARAAGAKGVKLADFVLDFDAVPLSEVDEQSPEEMSRQLAKIAGLFDATHGR